MVHLTATCMPKVGNEQGYSEEASSCGLIGFSATNKFYVDCKDVMSTLPKRLLNGNQDDTGLTWSDMTSWITGGSE